MSIVIVTENQYILAKGIYHITLDEDYKTDSAFRLKEYTYTITVVYQPDVNSNNSRDERLECAVTLKSKVNAYKVYKNLISQIREQMPDKLFLDKAVENLLNQDDLERIAAESEAEKKSALKARRSHDRSPKKIRGAREKKRRNKAVFR